MLVREVLATLDVTGQLSFTKEGSVLLYQVN